MFLESVIIAIGLSGSVDNPADYATPFTESCRPQQEISYRDTYFQLLPIENPQGQEIVLSTLDPLIKLSAAYTCICFETAFSDIKEPITYVDLWNSVQFMAEGNAEEARRLLQPLRNAPRSVRERFERQTNYGEPLFKSCVTERTKSFGDVPFYSTAIIILRGKLGFIRY